MWLIVWKDVIHITVERLPWKQSTIRHANSCSLSAMRPTANLFNKSFTLVAIYAPIPHSYILLCSLDATGGAGAEATARGWRPHHAAPAGLVGVRQESPGRSQPRGLHGGRPPGTRVCHASDARGPA